MINLDEIEEQVAKVISYSQGIDQTNITDMIKRWYDAKSHFISQMGGLIYELPDTYYFSLSQQEKEGRIENFISILENERDLSNDEYDSLAQFIRFEKDGFFTNTVVEQYYRGEIKIEPGSKLLRAFKYFIKDSELRHRLQDKASMIIQEDKIDGKLCLSVHPLDYLSLSENDHNWRSCHALDGEYRAGNLSYMCDRSTVICYLKSLRDANLPHFPQDMQWNSKKWRVLCFFSSDNNMIFAGRQYPFESKEGIELVKDTLIPAALKLKYCAWRKEKISTIPGWYPNGDAYYLDSKYIPLGSKLIGMHNLIKDDSNLHFNDLLRSSFYDPIYAFKKVYDHPWFLRWDEMVEDERYAKETLGSYRDTRFHIGSHPACCRCGKDLIYNTDTLLCKDCVLDYGPDGEEDLSYCPICGSRFWNDDGFWINSEERLICPTCFDNEYAACDHCGDYVLADDLHEVEEGGPYLCNRCYSRIHGDGG